MDDTAPRPAAFNALTDREIGVLRLIATGRSNSEIAAQLIVSEPTIKTHINRLFRKLQLRDRITPSCSHMRPGSFAQVTCVRRKASRSARGCVAPRQHHAPGPRRRHHRGMASLRGRLLLAGPTLIDPNFFRSVVLMLEHTHEGAIGVILNRPTDLPVSEALPPWSFAVSAPDVVFVGGPVGPGTAIALGQGPDVDQLVGPFGMVDLDADPYDFRHVRLFSGYAGWGPGQLERELAEGAWIVLDALPEDLLTPDADDLWSAVLARQPHPLSLLALYPDEPAFN
ncbi:MAG TPA: YqgE/AlgH family protein [Acidimicrobiales bacterium]